MKKEQVEKQTKSAAGTVSTFSYRFRMTESEYARLNDESAGLCIACGDEAGECEPDTRSRKCEAYGEPCVFGVEELLLFNRIIITEA